jgi:hypothetical protein
MTALLILLSIIALCGAISASRQTTRTLRAWQMALEALHTELRGRQAPAQAPSSCPCTCHPLPPTTRQPWPR